MSERIVVVGAVAAGASAAAKARRTNEQAEIILFERGPFMSWANCGLPYYVGGEIASRDALFVATPERFRGFFRVDVRLQTEVTAIDAAARTLAWRRADGETGTMLYDRLILATGTVPITPPIEGLDAPSVFSCRTVPDVDAILARLHEVPSAPVDGVGPSALVIGGGYIGLECAEQLLRRGFRTTVVEAQDQLIGPLDPEMAYPVQRSLESAGVRVLLRTAVRRIEAEGQRWRALCGDGEAIPFDIAIVGTGVRPSVELARSAGLVLGKTGAIAVDRHQRTSDPSIFAAGDNCEAVFGPTGEPVSIPLAGPANKQGRVAGQNAALDLAGAPTDDRRRLTAPRVLGTAIVRVGETVAGGTGLGEKLARRLGRDVRVSWVFGSSHAGYYPGARQMLVKLVWAPDTGRLLGAQAVGEEGVDKRLDVLATAIHAGLGVEDLEELDLCYAPPFASAKDVEVMAGFVASNAKRETSPTTSPLALDDILAADGALYLLDVRTPPEFAGGALPGAHNIPLDQLRGRFREIPRDRPIVVNCGTGYRSYIAQRILLESGWTDVRNLPGGYTLARRILEMQAQTKARAS